MRSSTPATTRWRTTTLSCAAADASPLRRSDETGILLAAPPPVLELVECDLPWVVDEFAQRLDEIVDRRGCWAEFCRQGSPQFENDTKKFLQFVIAVAFDDMF